MSDRVGLAVSAPSEKPENRMTQVLEPPARIDEDLVAQLCGGARADGISIDGEGGLLAQMTKLVVESALEGEMADHLGYDKHVKGASQGGNALGGTRSKTIATKAGPAWIDVPRDRAATFTPQIEELRQRRLGSIEDVVLSLSARGMTHGDIAAHLADVYRSTVTRDDHLDDHRHRDGRHERVFPGPVGPVGPHRPQEPALTSGLHRRDPCEGP